MTYKSAIMFTLLINVKIVTVINTAQIGREFKLRVTIYLATT